MVFVMWFILMCLLCEMSMEEFKVVGHVLDGLFLVCWLLLVVPE